MPHRLGAWKAERGAGGIIHLIPEGDTMEHDIRNCSCKPAIEFFRATETEEVCIMTHHSGDHREDRFRNNEQ